MQLPLENYKNLRVCVALSGGADSVCLLHYLKQNGAEFGITLSALTCEHGIRGEASLRDLRFVEELCAKWEIPLAVFRADVPAFASQSGRGLEEEGRAFRYACFEMIVAAGKADVVATAHHKDDVAETALFRLIRGTSLKGLALIEERDKIIRPMLDVSRAEIESYAKEYGLSFVTDESNFSEKYTRNFLRLQVMPRLEEAVPGAADHLADFCKKAARDDRYLQEIAREKITRRGGLFALPLSLPAPLFSRAVVLCLNELGLERDYTEANVEAVLSLCEKQSGKRIELPHGIAAVREGDEVVFMRKAGHGAGEGVEREIPFMRGEFIFGEFEIGIETQTCPVDCGFPVLYADGKKFPAGCVVRTRRTGDVFRPFGGGEKSLKKFLTDKKIPARLGHALPVIANGNRVYAVFGVEISDEVKTDSDEPRVFLWIRKKKNCSTVNAI